MSVIATEKIVQVVQVNDEAVVTAVEKQTQIVEARDALVIYQSGEAMGFGRGVVASCAVAHFQKYTKDLEYHYEDKDGNVLKEVRALTGN